MVHSDSRKKEQSIDKPYDLDESQHYCVEEKLISRVVSVMFPFWGHFQSRSVVARVYRQEGVSL